MAPSPTAATAQNPRKNTPKNRSRCLFVVLLVLALAVVAALAARGWSYYTTPLIERPRHPDYWTLKPGGSWGRAYGIAGATLMVAMLGYSVRKRWRPLRRAGALSTWLGFHILCGIVGPLLVVLHTSFKFGGLVALSFWSMVVVALSGLVGRYLYRQIPRRRSGDELSLAEAEAEERTMSARLVEWGLDPSALGRLDAAARAAPPSDTSLALLLVRLPLDGWSLRRRLRTLERGFGDVPPRARRRLLRLVRERAALTRRIVLWRRLQALFHYWHVAHKPFAALMYFFLVVHVVVVSLAGYGWGG